MADANYQILPHFSDESIKLNEEHNIYNPSPEITNYCRHKALSSRRGSDTSIKPRIKGKSPLESSSKDTDTQHTTDNIIGSNNDSRQSTISTKRIFIVEGSIDKPKEEDKHSLGDENNTLSKECIKPRETQYDFENINDNPYEEVRAIVSTEDDINTPSLTFRVWTLGILFLTIMACTNQVFFFRDIPIKLSIVVVQILSYPLGRLMAWVLPKSTYVLSFWGNTRSWSLNPGPFSFKEMVLITIFSSAGGSSAYGIDVVVINRKWYGLEMSFWPSVMMCLSSQLIGYGMAGLVQSLLVRPASMVWRENLVSISVFNSFYPDQDSSNSNPYGNPRWTRARFFWAVCGLSTIWYIVPGFLFQTLSSLSLLCIIFPKNHLVHIIGSGRAGLGLLSFTFDWNSVSNSYLPGPISTPFSVACNILVSFAVFLWVVIPAIYFNNAWGSANIPLYDYHLYTQSGSLYNMSRIIQNGLLDEEAYKRMGPIKISVVYALSYGAGFAGLTSLISYILLRHGSDIWKSIRETHTEREDVHTRLMSRYEQIPSWWFISTFIASSAAGLISCQILEFGLPWWAFLLSLAIPVIFLIPVGYIQATTNMQPGLNIVTELLIGFILPGRPVANMAFKVFGYITMTQSLNLISDLKLGHYAKIPPRHMFLVQFVSTILSVFIELLVTYILMDRVPELCTGYPWSCRSASVFYSASVLYGAIGPVKMFLSTPYRALFWGFLIGLVLPIPIHYLQQKYRSVYWIQEIHIPVMLNFLGFIPIISPMWIPAWFVVNFVVNVIVRRYKPAWFHHYSYALSGAMDTGILITGLALSFAFASIEDRMYWWGSSIDQCPLARKPWNSE